MAAVELAVGYVTLTAETRSLARDVGRAFSGVESQAGRAGQSMGRAMAQGFEANQPDIGALRRDVWTAHQKIAQSAEQSAKKQQDAARKVEIAQAKVNETVAKYGASSSQALTAVDRLSTAQQRLEAETLAAASAQDRLERELRQAQDAVTAAAASSESAARTYATGWRGVGQRIGAYLSRGVQDASEDAEGEAEQGGERSGSAFGNAFKAGLGLIAAKFSVDSIVGGIQGAITGAGDMEQSIGALDSVFKTSSAQMHAWSRDASTAVGLSSNEYNELATLLGAQLKNAGVSLDDAGSKANGLIGTGADLSSMFGGTAADAVEALSSALKGEMDPIEKYGITLNEATLKAQAMADGLLKPVKDSAKVETAMMKMDLAQHKYNETVAKYGPESNQAMSAQIALTGAQNAFNTASEGSLPAMDSQTKAMATLAAIEKQSADAKGNFAKEEDTFSHKQQVAAAQWEDVSAKIGGLFLPAATAAFGFIGDKALPILDEVIGGIKAFGAAFSSTDDDITSAGFAGHMERFGQIVRDNIGWIIALAAGVTGYVVAVKTIMIVKAVGNAIRTMAAAQWGLNAAMAANPIGIAVAILAALVVGFIMAYKRIGWFKDFVDGSLKAVGDLFSWLYEKAVKPAFEGIMTAAGAVVDWWSGTLVPALESVGKWFTDIWQGASKAVGVATKWIQDAIGNVIGWIQQNWGLLLTIILGPLGFIIQWVVKNFAQISAVVQAVFAKVAAVFTWIYESIIKPVFSGIFTVVNGFYMFFRGIFQLVVALIVLHLAPAFMNFWNGTIKPVFEGIRNTIASWWFAAQVIFAIVVAFIKGAFSAAFTWLRDSVITPVFDFIKNKIAVWWLAVKITFATAVAFVRGAFSAAFTWLRDSVITPVFNFIKNAITVWWTGTKFIFDTAVGFIRTTLSSAFTWLRDTIIAPVFNGIRDKISSVWNTGIKPVFDFLSNAIKKDVPNAFQTGVDSVESIWDKLLNIAKTPVRFVIDKVINEGLIGAFNAVAGFIDPGQSIVKRLPPVAKPAGFRSGGYTGRVGRDQIAGVVHGDEHVIRSESRRTIERAAPGLLERFNQMGARALAGFGYRAGGRVNPTKNMGLTQGYHAGHDGIDIGVGVGTPVFSTGPGVVSFAGSSPNLGNIWGGNEIRVMGDGLERWFSHLSQIGVRVGQQVSAGQQIGLSGNSGITSGPHLHFGVYAGGYPNSMNPLSYLAGASAPSGGSTAGGFLDPFGALTKLADGVVGRIKDAIPGGGFMVDAAGGMGKKLITDVIGWGKSKLGMGASGGATPTLFDGGGWLTNTGQPQLIDHQRSRPDAVLTNQQWRDVSTLVDETGTRSGGNTYNLELPQGSSPEAFIDAIRFEDRKNARGGARV